MKEQIKTIGISSLITLGIVLLVAIVPGFFEKPKYFCETRPELGVVECDSFSKYVAENGKCIRNDSPNLICREGWSLVTDDSEYIESILEPIQYRGLRYSCTKDGCVEVKK